MGNAGNSLFEEEVGRQVFKVPLNDKASPVPVVHTAPPPQTHTHRQSGSRMRAEVFVHWRAALKLLSTVGAEVLPSFSVTEAKKFIFINH